MMHISIAVVIAVIISGLCIMITYNATKAAYMADLERYKRCWEEGKRKTKFECDKKVERLNNENLELTKEINRLKKQNHDLMEAKFNLRKALDIKTTSAKGLEISAKQWREAFLSLGDLTKVKVEEHEQEIEKLTAYYQEKLNEEKKHSMDIAEELREARAFGNYPYESKITMEVSDNND